MWLECLLLLSCTCTIVLLLPFWVTHAGTIRFIMYDQILGAELFITLRYVCVSASVLMYICIRSSVCVCGFGDFSSLSVLFCLCPRYSPVWLYSTCWSCHWMPFHGCSMVWWRPGCHFSGFKPFSFFLISTCVTTTTQVCDLFTDSIKLRIFKSASGFRSLFPFLQAFTCLALFNLMKVPINAYPRVINRLVESSVSERRVNAFLELSDHDITGHCSTSMRIRFS